VGDEGGSGKRLGQLVTLFLCSFVAEMAACPVTEANLVDVTALPVPLRWMLAIAVTLISGFFAGELEGDGGRGGERDGRCRDRAPASALSFLTLSHILPQE